MVKRLLTLLIFLLFIKFCIAQNADTTKYGVFKIGKPHKTIISSDTIYDYSQKRTYSKQKYPKCFCYYVDFYMDEKGEIINPVIVNRSWGKKYDKKMIHKVETKTAFGMNDLENNKSYTIEVCVETYWKNNRRVTKAQRKKLRALSVKKWGRI